MYTEIDAPTAATNVAQKATNMLLSLSDVSPFQKIPGCITLLNVNAPTVGAATVATPIHPAIALLNLSTNPLCIGGATCTGPGAAATTGAGIGPIAAAGTLIDG